jgi:hypothetical protein
MSVVASTSATNAPRASSRIARAADPPVGGLGLAAVSFRVLLVGVLHFVALFMAVGFPTRLRMAFCNCYALLGRRPASANRRPEMALDHPGCGEV